MKCPTCDKDMVVVGNSHWHCQDCNYCNCNGMRYQFFIRTDETYCPKEQDWKKDAWLKTGNLA